jgi:predicted ABC-type ATPase
MRVRLGGHDVPKEIVRRRFGRSVTNFFALYRPLADEWMVFDNSTANDSTLVASHNERATIVEDEKTWRRLQRMASRPPSRR